MVQYFNICRSDTSVLLESKGLYHKLETHMKDWKEIAVALLVTLGGVTGGILVADMIKQKMMKKTV